MRVSTSQMFDRPLSLMTQLTAQADKAQTQIATTKKIDGAADSPTAWLRLQGLARAGADDTAYGANIKLAQGILAQSDGTLDSVQSQLTRAKELTLEASNGTLTDENRLAIAEELDSIRDSLFGLANTKDVRGQPLFGSATGDTAYAKAPDGTISFVGAGDPAKIPVGDGDAIQPSIGGAQAFAAGSSDMFAVLAHLSAALKAGGDISQASADAITGVDASLDSVAAARASVGARAARLDLSADQLVDAGEARESERSGLEDTDIPTAITQLQKTLTVLQATQASFSKLSSLSLFDYLN
ncbi:flagellin [Sphingomonas sp. dw_22]|uniref:flagellin N-terminal helical domain-containing protein n=1 Tax=Sphingomonas sp. dw_22 TaxID=2721175 RepID=UPI001BD30453|nr:flagellin [Sphingomonas sp. dw_22]